MTDIFEMFFITDSRSIQSLVDSLRYRDSETNHFDYLNVIFTTKKDSKPEKDILFGSYSFFIENGLLIYSRERFPHN